jgi:signal transduction histidine kinase
MRLEKGTVGLLPPPACSQETTGANIGKTIHDIRSSINIIMGYSELMLDGVLGNMTEEQRDGLKDILTNTQQMLDLVNDITIWQNPPSSSKP